MSPAPSAGDQGDEDLGIARSSSTPDAKPKVAFELSGTGSYIANPYLENKGWTLETGANKGMRLEATLMGIQLAYELSSLGNEQACSSSACVAGDFGSTTFHSFELGYRLRFSNIGPVRPFVTASVGGVLASSGDWSMQTSATMKGGSGRAGFGVEYPIAGTFFASVTLAYRVLITESPFHDKSVEAADKFLLGTGTPPSGTYAEDLHLVSGYIGIGATL